MTEKTINGFTHDQINLKVQSFVPKATKEYALIVAYIDSPNIMDKFDEKYKSWSTEFTPLPQVGKCSLKCTLAVVTKDNFEKIFNGIGSGDNWKEAESDAFKRVSRQEGTNRFLWKQRQLFVKRTAVERIFKKGKVTIGELIDAGILNLKRMEINYDKLPGESPQQAKLKSVETHDDKTLYQSFMWKIQQSKTTAELKTTKDQLKVAWAAFDALQKTEFNTEIKRVAVILKDGIEEMSDPKENIWTAFVGDTKNKGAIITLSNAMGKIVSKKRLLDYVNQVHGDLIRKRSKVTIPIKSRKEIPLGIFDDVMTWVKNEVETFNKELGDDNVE